MKLPTQYGIYVVCKDGLIPLSKIFDSWPDISHVQSVPHIERDNHQLELILYQKDYRGTYEDINFRTLDANGNQCLHYSVEPLAETDMYKLTCNVPVEDGQFLFISTGWSEAMAGFLGDPEKELIFLLSNASSAPAHVAEKLADAATRAFPDNRALKLLLKQWREYAKKERETHEFNFACDAWNKYQNETCIATRIRLLSELERESHTYLDNYPAGQFADQCRAWLVSAEKNLEKLGGLV